MTTARDQVVRAARLAAMVRGERERLARVAAECEQAKADYAESVPPLRELRGVGAILHDFYTGVERILERVAAELEGGLPAGPGWHRDLLQAASIDLPGIRPRVLAPSTVASLDEFLRFRHLFRNLYGFELEWGRLRPLLERVAGAWPSVQTDLDVFLAFLDSLASDRQA